MQEKPRKILRTGTNTSYEKLNNAEHKQEDQVEQRFTDAFDFIASENANSITPLYCVDTSAPSGTSFNRSDKKPNESASSVHDVKAVDSFQAGLQISVANNQANTTQSSPKNETKIKMEEVAAPQQTFTQHSGTLPSPSRAPSCETSEGCNSCSALHVHFNQAIVETLAYWPSLFRNCSVCLKKILLG